MMIQTLALYVSSPPPGFAVRHQNFVPLLDGFAPAPYTHAKLATIGPPLLEEGVRLRMNTAVVINKSGLVASVLRIYADADMVRSATQG